MPVSASTSTGMEDLRLFSIADTETYTEEKKKRKVAHFL